jgi:hypothetical protein
LKGLLMPKLLQDKCPRCHDEAVKRFGMDDDSGFEYWIADGWWEVDSAVGDGFVVVDGLPPEAPRGVVVIDYCPFCGLRLKNERSPAIRELYTAVTGAIFRAEHLPAGSAEAQLAFHEVYVLEHSIAKITEPFEMEGLVARRGRVTAALSAGDHTAARIALLDHLVEIGYSPKMILEILTELKSHV